MEGSRRDEKGGFQVLLVGTPLLLFVLGGDFGDFVLWLGRF